MKSKKITEKTTNDLSLDTEWLSNFKKLDSETRKRMIDKLEEGIKQSYEILKNEDKRNSK
jgi:hypothetical protein